MHLELMHRFLFWDKAEMAWLNENHASVYRYVSNSDVSRLPNMWAVVKALHLHAQTSCFYSLFFLATSVRRNCPSRGSSLRERRCGALPVQHQGQSRPGRQGKSSHKFTSKLIPSFGSLPKMYFLAFAPPSAGARNPTALRCVARLFSSSPGSVPGRLPCGRKEPGGRESAADCVCSGLCGHRGVPDGAPGQRRGQWQGDEHFSKWMQDFFWHNTIFVRLLIWHLLCLCCAPVSGRPHSPPPGRTKVSGRSGPLPPQTPLPRGPARPAWQHASAHCLQGWKPAHRHGNLQRQCQPWSAQQGEHNQLKPMFC